MPSTCVVTKPQEIRTSFKIMSICRIPKATKGGLFYDPQENRVFVSTKATFLEEDHVKNHQPRKKISIKRDPKEATNKTTRVVDQAGPSTSVIDGANTSGQSHPSQELRMPQRSGRIITQPDRYLGLAETQVIIPDDGVEDPSTYKQVMNDEDRDQWIKSMNLEMKSMYFNSFWELVDQPDGVKPIGCKWIYKRKRG